MSDYIALFWPDDDPAADSRAFSVRWRLSEAKGWVVGLEALGACIWVRAERPLPIRRSGDGHRVCIGDMFHRRGQGTRPLPMDALANIGADPATASKALCRAAWGRYVAIFSTPGSPAKAVFRDPSGALDCLVAQDGRVTLLTSHLGEEVLGAFPLRLSLDWRRIGAILENPTMIGGDLALRGVDAVGPGVLRRLDGPRLSDTAIWTPSHFGRKAYEDSDDARQALVQIVDATVEAFAGAGRPILAEVSGGLDSSIVATALSRTRSAHVVQWLNYHVDEPQGDERGYARALAQRLGVPLTEAAKPGVALSIEAFAGVAKSARPCLNALDLDYDQDIAARCVASGATQILTGQGGDTVFLQGGFPLLAADLMRRGRFSRQQLLALADIARWSRRSIWSVWAVAARANLGLAPRLAPRPPAYLKRSLAGFGGRMVHPWLKDLAGVPPAKRLQIYSLARGLLAYGRSYRAQQADVVHPLLSQPVLEHCLSLSTVALTGDGDDRALARRAFADRLPEVIVRRRSKGDLTAFYGRMIARSLPAVRDHLLGGTLAQAGLVDPDRLDAVLTEEHLIWNPAYREILELLAIETWARHWQGRVSQVRAGVQVSA